MASLSARISSAKVWLLPPVMELARLARSLLNLVWKDSNSDLVTVLVLLPMLELSLRGLAALTAAGSGGNSSVDSGSKTNRMVGVRRLVENLGIEPLSLVVATLLHVLECMDWMELSSSSQTETVYSLLRRLGRGRSVDGAAAVCFCCRF